MIKKLVAIAIVSIFILCGSALADEDIESQLDKLTEESAIINGVLLKPHDAQSLEEAEANPVTEDLIDRDIIPEAEARRLGGN
jgi:hypothetical protein